MLAPDRWLMGWRESLSRARRHPEAGFTIVELTVALGIFAAAMVVMTTMMASGLKGVLQGKQRSSATTEANAVLERAHNLAYDDVGLVSTDTTLGTDAQIVLQGGQKYYRTDDPCTAGATRLEPVQYALNPANHPYNPHQTSYKVGPTSITRYVYVTGVDATCPTPDGVVDHKRVVVRTVFDNPAYSAGAVSNEVRAQTFISRSTPGSPNNPPPNAAIPPLSGQALARAATTSILVDTGPDACIDPPSPPSTPPPSPAPPVCVPDSLLFSLDEAQGLTTVLKSSLVSCTSKTPQLTVEPALSPKDNLGPHTLSNSADDDSSNGSPGPGPNTQTQNYSDTPESGKPVDDYLLQPAVVSTATCNSSAVSLPTESGTAMGVTGVTYVADVTGLGLGVNTVELVAASGDRSDQSIVHSGATPAAREIAFSATRVVNGMSALKVNTLGLAASSGLVNVLPMTVSASSRVNSTTPSTTPGIAVGTGLDVEIFDPSETLPPALCTGRLPGQVYCKIHVDANAGGFTGITASVTTNMGSDKNNYPYSFQTSVQLNPKRIFNGTSTPGGKLYEAEYTPMTATTRLILRVPNLAAPGTYTPYFDAQVQLDLGQILARGCYGIASGVAGCL